MIADEKHARGREDFRSPDSGLPARMPIPNTEWQDLSRRILNIAFVFKDS